MTVRARRTHRGAWALYEPRYDPGMEPNRFDDVEIRIVEEPTPPAPRRQPRRLGHAAAALTAAAVVAGTLAAGASALTSTAQAPTRPAAKSQGVERHHV